MTLSFNFIGGGLGAYGAMIVSLTSNLPRRLIKLFLYLVQSPFRVFALGECLPEVIHFFAEKFRIDSYTLFGPYGSGC